MNDQEQCQAYQSKVSEMYTEYLKIGREKLAEKYGIMEWTHHVGKSDAHNAIANIAERVMLGSAYEWEVLDLMSGDAMFTITGKKSR